MSHDSELEARRPAVPEVVLDDDERVSLCEVLHRVLNEGAVIAGEATVSVADIDPIYLGLQVVLTSIETARKAAYRAPVALDAGVGIAKATEYGTAGKYAD